MSRLCPEPHDAKVRVRWDPRKIRLRQDDDEDEEDEEEKRDRDDSEDDEQDEEDSGYSV
jgi:hypothetical protein